MNFDDYLPLFWDMLDGKRHDWYDRTVIKADLYRTLITGVGMDKELRKFNKREDDDLFEQRKLITQQVCSAVADNVEEVFFKVPRSLSLNRILENKDTDKLDELEGIMNKFWGVDSLDDYMATRWIELNFIDPNAFVVIEWKDFDNTVERATPYPFEVRSKDVMNYEMDNRVLEWLLVEGMERKNVLIKEKIEEKEIYSYTLYYKGGAVKWERVYLEDIINIVIEEKKVKKVGEFNYIRKKKDDDFVYRIIETESKLDYIPAYRVGYKRDQYTDGDTFVNPFDSAVPYFKKLINLVSEMDLTVALHVFPQVFQYVKRCSNDKCEGGRVYNAEGVSVICSSCNGIGGDIITSAQDRILLPLPFNREDILDLSGLIYSHRPDIDLITFQKEYVEYLIEQIKTNIFNSDVFTREEIQETATGKNIALQNVYDTLYPCSVAYSTDWKNYVDAVADITDLRDGLISLMTFGKDFKLKTLDDLYRELKIVTDSGADYFIKMSVQDDIANIIYSDDIHSMRKYHVKKRFFPFSGMTQEQIMYVMSGNTVREFDKVLWSNYGNIFDRLEMEDEDFYLRKEAVQWEMIVGMVEGIMEEVKEERPMVVMNRSDEEEIVDDKEDNKGGE